MSVLLKPKTALAKVSKKVNELSERDLEKYLFQKEEDDLFYIDTGDNEPVQQEEEQPAWVDDDEVTVNIQEKNRLRKLKTDFDETLISSTEYEKRLRSQFERMNPTPKWATVNDTNSVLASTKRMVQTKQIDPERLHVTRVSDANQDCYSNCVVQKCQFHPTAPVLMTAGFDKKVHLFNIDEKKNQKVASYFIKDLPIFSASFSPDGNEIFVTGRRNYFYTIDLAKGTTDRIHSIQGRSEKSLEKSYYSKCGKYICVLGKDGYIIILSSITKKWMANVKMNSLVVSLAFTNEHMWSLALDGSVYQWDLKSMTCLHRFTDQGCIKGTVMTISPDEKWIAIGSMAGVVNVYSISTCLEFENPEPSKVLMNLTTAITTVEFHPSSDILAFASHDVKDALRLYHLPTQKVVKNWPTSNTPLGYVSTVSFSPSGRHIAMGNAKGKVLLYRLEAFS